MNGFNGFDYAIAESPASDPTNYYSTSGSIEFMPDQIAGVFADPNDISRADILRSGSENYTFAEGSRSVPVSDILRGVYGPGAEPGSNRGVLDIINTLGQAATRTVEAIMSRTPQFRSTSSGGGYAPSGSLIPPSFRQMFTTGGGGLTGNPLALIAFVLIAFGGLLLLRRA